MTDPIQLTAQRRQSSRIFGSLTVFAFLLLTAAPLHAHHLPPWMEEVDEFEDLAAFMAGLRHPLSGIDHWLFAGLLGVIVYASNRVRAATTTALIVCALIGGTAGQSGMAFPLPQFSLLIAAAALGFMIFLKDRMPLVLQTCLVCLSVLLQSNEHTQAWPLESGGLIYMAGVFSSTGLIALAASFLASGAVRLKNSTRFATGSRFPLTSH